MAVVILNLTATKLHAAAARQLLCFFLNKCLRLARVALDPSPVASLDARRSLAGATNRARSSCLNVLDATCLAGMQSSPRLVQPFLLFSILLVVRAQPNPLPGQKPGPGGLYIGAPMPPRLPVVPPAPLPPPLSPPPGPSPAIKTNDTGACPRVLHTGCPATMGRAAVLMHPVDAQSGHILGCAAMTGSRQDD
ncbi:hypothetical protein HaLaN_11452 [Haematococcus lacustris]|uniref:Uncharacterized protein n=1 Tax=Haematococcus lacustris TaxID=44745 RepID=A0A699YY96_HAELA|nr:hypothetical protein HaLaN_11452 [Haematococcus lacustris]